MKMSKKQNMLGKCLMKCHLDDNKAIINYLDRVSQACGQKQVEDRDTGIIPQHFFVRTLF